MINDINELNLEVDVVVNQFIKDLQYRSFPFGEGEGEWGLLNRITERTRVQRNISSIVVMKPGK